MSTFFLALAILIGPSLAVVAFALWRRLEHVRQLQMDTFQTMLRCRRLWLSPDWTNAMQIAPIAFAKHDAVIAALDNLSKCFNDVAWTGSELQRERITLDTEAAVSAALQHMADSLQLQFDVARLRGRVQAPVGWTAEYIQDRILRDLVIQVLQGARPLRVQNIDRETTRPAAPTPMRVPAE